MKIKFLDDDEENTYIDKMLNISNDDEPLDGLPKATSGEKAVNDYFSHYKKLEQIEDQNHRFGITGSIFTKLQKGFTKNGFPPLKLGFIKSAGENSKINLRHYNLSNSHLEVITTGIRKNASIKSL